MSTDVSALFRSLYATQVKELKELAQKAKDLPTTKALTEKQGQTCQEQEAKVNEIISAIPKAKEERAQAFASANAALQTASTERTTAQEDLEVAKRNKAAAEAALAAAKAAAQKSSQPPKGQVSSAGQRYSKFIQTRAMITSDVQWRVLLLNKIRDLDEPSLRTVDLTDAFALADSWETTRTNTEECIASLAREGNDLARLGARSTDVTVLEQAFKELKAVKATQDSRLQKERTRRDEVETNIGAFVKEQGKLLQWCRTQQAQLETLVQSEHVQEFCGSLQSNNATMEANFLVLSDMAESLLPSEVVLKALQEVSKAWFSLQVYTYERLRQCLMEQHQKSKLEDELRAWSTFALPVKDYLADVERLLGQPTDDDTIAYIQPYLEACKALINEYTPHQLIADHVSDFSLRMQCLQDNYAMLRKSVFSAMSIQCQALAVGTTSWKRKEEYSEKLSEMMDWVDVKGHVDTWKDLLVRVDRLKKVIEENESSQGIDEALRN